MRKKSYELAKLEKYRESIFTDDLKICYICSQRGIIRPASEKHEILYGRNRRNSMLFGYVLPLCRDCHTTFTSNQKVKEIWGKKCQRYHEEKYGVDDWMSHFHKSYL